MTDGPEAAVELDKTEANKAFIRAFVDDILVNGRMARLTTYFDGDRYVQDLFRVQEGKIAEHWDTIEAIPPRAEWKNDNGKFGF